MDEILRLLSQYPIALLVIGILFSLSFVLIIIIYLVAFFQGREISLYPPKIGEKREKTETAKTKSLSLDKDITQNNPEEKKESVTEFKISPTDIYIDEKALNDCSEFKIAPQSLIDFLLLEVKNHPSMFSTKFPTTPLILNEHIILVSWDGNIVRVEKILAASKASHNNDAWLSCVSLYRQATTLSYRRPDPNKVLTPVEFQRSLTLLKKLVRNVKFYISLLKANGLTADLSIKDFEIFLDEAEFAFASNDANTSVVRMEVVLSAVHKILLRYVSLAENELNTAPSMVGDKGKSILIVDDQHYVRLDILEELKSSVESFKFAQAKNTADAMKALVENQFDIVILDLNMPDSRGLKSRMAGYEVADSIRKLLPHAKIVIYTGYSDSILIDEGKNKSLYDFYCIKGKESLVAIIKDLTNE